jgi:hypothetical protein
VHIAASCRAACASLFPSMSDAREKSLHGTVNPELKWFLLAIPWGMTGRMGAIYPVIITS